MSRRPLSLYALDRPRLVELSDALREALARDDRAALARLLELGPGLSTRMEGGERAVDWFLRPEDDPDAAPFFASLRRVAKKRALERRFTSDALSLEGRLRQFDVLREEEETARLLDRLLDLRRLPWFLAPPGATGGWLDEASRASLAGRLRELSPALPAEIAAFGAALDEIEGDVIAHDALG